MSVENKTFWQIDKMLDNFEDYLEEHGGAVLNEDMERAFEEAIDRKDELMEKTLYVMMESEDEVAKLFFRIEKLQKLAEQKERKVESCKKLLTYAVKKYGATKIDEFKLALRPSVSTDTSGLELKLQDVITNLAEDSKTKEIISDVIILSLKDEPQLVKMLDKICRIKVSVAPDKQEIKKLLKNEVTVTGCSLVEKDNLRIS